MLEEENKAAPEKPPSPPQKPPLSPITTTTTTKTLPKNEVPANKKHVAETVPPPESTSELIAVFSNHEDFLSTKITESDAQSSSTSMSRKPTAMQYFYGFSDVVSAEMFTHPLGIVIVFLDQFSQFSFSQNKHNHFASFMKV